MIAVLVAVNLVHLTGPVHQAIEINPAAVTSIREPRGGAVHSKVGCLVFTADGKFISVAESCDRVRALIGQ